MNMPGSIDPTNPERTHRMNALETKNCEIQARMRRGARSRKLVTIEG